MPQTTVLGLPVVTELCGAKVSAVGGQRSRVGRQASGWRARSGAMRTDCTVASGRDADEERVARGADGGPSFARGSHPHAPYPHARAAPPADSKEQPLHEGLAQQGERLVTLGIIGEVARAPCALVAAARLGVALALDALRKLVRNDNRAAARVALTRAGWAVGGWAQSSAIGTCTRRAGDEAQLSRARAPRRVSSGCLLIRAATSCDELQRATSSGAG